jgi:hypothetical protein
MWLKKFKLALIKKEVETMETLLDEMPEFDTLDELKEAAYLIKEAYGIMTQLQSENEKVLGQLRKNIQFLNATQHEAPTKLDITS